MDSQEVGQMRSLRSHSDLKRERLQEVQDITAQKRVQEVREPLMRERLLAEFVGTFFLVLTVSVSVAGSGSMAPVAIGLVLGVQIYTFGAVSGGFLNPAVTLAVLLSGRRKISASDAVLYMLAQCLGGIAAGLAGLSATEDSFCFAAVKSNWKSFELETLFTMALCSTVLAAGTSNDAPNHYFGFAIGLTVTGGALACGGFDQGSFNPAVTIGINAANYANADASSSPGTTDWLLFLIAPFVGAALAAGVFRGTRGNEFVDADGEPFSSDED